VPGFVTYQRDDANVPDRVKGRRVFDDVRVQPPARQCRALRPDVIGRVFREDLYRQARELLGPPPGNLIRPLENPSRATEISPLDLPMLSLAS
jgi:hypothetical protein